MTDERLKMWLSFWKWFLSTIVVTGGIAVTTAMVDAKAKSTELQLQINNQEKEYLTSFLDKALDDNLEKRHRFAQYFASLTTPGAYKDGWEAYLRRVEREVETTKTRLKELEDSLPGKSGEDLVRAEAELATLKAELQATKDYQRTAAIMERKSEPFTIQCTPSARLVAWPERSSGWIDGVAGSFFALGCVDVSGKLNGPWQSFYPNGQILESGTQLDGKYHGIGQLFHPNGKLAVKVKWEHGEHIGFVRWHSDGRKRDEFGNTTGLVESK